MFILRFFMRLFWRRKTSTQKEAPSLVKKEYKPRSLWVRIDNVAASAKVPYGYALRVAKKHNIETKMTKGDRYLFRDEAKRLYEAIWNEKARNFCNWRH